MHSSNPLQNTRIVIDACISVEGEAGFISGWAINNSGADDLYVVDSQGNRKSLLQDAARYHRPDVVDALGQEFGHCSDNAGFILFWPWPVIEGSLLHMVASKGQQLAVIGKKKWSGNAPERTSDLARLFFDSAAQWKQLQPMTEHRGEALFERILSALERRNANNTVHRWQLGDSPQRPSASVIVPLYGRWDFVQNQLLTFSSDADFLQHAELVYVIDDPQIVEAFTQKAYHLHKLYGVPFKIIWGGCNRGFAGACNLGATESDCDTLIFFNSDLFPLHGGWLSRFVEALEQNPDYGALGAALYFADGGIQHIGMQFEYSEELGVWLNIHPCKGIAPEDYAQQSGIIPRPAVTGACLAIRRKDFDAVGGFDTGYLIGDFEDSDLCMKIREQKLNIGYLPELKMTHLERQSFPTLGEGHFRQKVVLLNAQRHSKRWGEKIPSINHFETETA